MGKRRKLSRRITGYCFIFGLLLSSSIAILGIYVYQKSSINHYDQYIHNILKITERQVDVKDFERWVATLNDDDEEYRDTQARINNMKEASQDKMKEEDAKNKEYRIAFLFIVSPYRVMDGEIMYIMSAYIDSDREMDGSRIPDRLGDVAKAGEGYEDIQVELMDLFQTMKKENADEVRYVNNSNKYYKNLRTGVLPIKNEKEEIVAFVNAAVSVDGIKRDVGLFVIIVTLGTLLIMVTFLTFFIQRMGQSVAKPITILANNTFDFMKQVQEEKKPEDMAFQELRLKTGDEIESLSENLNKMTSELLDYMTNIESITMEKEHLKTELNVAKEIQTSMIPTVFPAFPERKDFEVFAFMKTAKEIGGDFYDFFLIDETHFCLVIASVQGKGIPAALFLVVARTLIKNFALMGLPPDKVFMETNNRMCENNEMNMYVNAFLGIIDLHNGKLQYANADHVVPLLRQGGGRYKPLTAQRGFVLAGLEDVPYHVQECLLRQGDILFFYTEGLQKAVDGDWLLNELNKALWMEYKLEGVMSILEEKWLESSERPEWKEDVTMMMFRYNGN